MIRLRWCWPRLCPLSSSHCLTLSGHFTEALITTFECEDHKNPISDPKDTSSQITATLLTQNKTNRECHNLVNSISGGNPMDSSYVLGASSLGISRPRFKGNLPAAWGPVYGEPYSLEKRVC